MVAFRIEDIEKRCTDTDKYHFYTQMKIGMNFKKEKDIDTGKKIIKFYTVGFTYQI